jgi:hypothetical protein
MNLECSISCLFSSCFQYKHMKTFLHKCEMWLEICNIDKELFLTHLKLEAFNNLKTSFAHFFKLHRWNFQQLEEVSFTHFFKLKCWISQQLEKHSSTLENLQHFEEVSSTSLTPLKSCKLLVCHHLEMNSHSLCKLKINFLSKGFSPSSMQIQAQNPSLLLVPTQCPFSCLVWAHNLLETTWKQARNERFKVHEMKQLY